MRRKREGMTVIILIALVIYAIVCAVIALIRAALDKRSTFKDSVRRTFWRLYLEALNPLNWLDWF